MRLLAALLLAPVLALNAGQPRLAVDSNHHSFGRIKQGDRPSHRFKLTNTGDAPLTLVRVTSACGCTSNVLGKSILAPEESTELEVAFNSWGYRGPTQKSVEVLTDDPVTSTTTLSFDAEIEKEIIVPSREAYFQDLGPRDRRKASLKLESGTNQPITVTDVGLSPAPWLGVATREAGEDLYVDLELFARQLPPSKRKGSDTVTLHLANPNPSVITLSAHWEKRPEVIATPARLAWAEAAGKELAAVVVLERRDHKTFRVVSSRTTNPLLQVKDTAKARARKQKVEILFSGAAKPGDYAEGVFLTLDPPGGPELEIRVAATLH